MEIKRLNVSGQLKRSVFEIVPVRTLHYQYKLLGTGIGWEWGWGWGAQ